MNDLDEFVNAWAESDFARKPTDARKLIGLASKKLKQRMRALIPSGRLTPHGLGRTLSNNRDVPVQGFVIRAEFHAGLKLNRWYLEPITGEEQRKLRYEALKAEQKHIATQEIARPREPHRRKQPKLAGDSFVLASPSYSDVFIRESSAEAFAQKLRAGFFDATVDFLPNARFAVRVAGTGIDELANYCREQSIYLKLREIKRASGEAMPDTESLLPTPGRNDAMARLGYIPELKFIQRATGDDPRAARKAPRFRSFRWSPFDV